jgi:hypothetical protein
MKLERPSRPEGSARTLAVEAGQVVCPRRGLIDIELCWACPAYDGLSTGRFEGVVCRGSMTPEPTQLRSVVA